MDVELSVRVAQLEILRHTTDGRIRTSLKIDDNDGVAAELVEKLPLDTQAPHEARPGDMKLNTRLCWPGLVQ